MSKRPSEDTGSKKAWFGWTLFEPRDSEGKHTCKICRQKIKYSNSTSNFKAHFESKHPAQWAEAKEKKQEIQRLADLQSEGLALSSPSILEFLDPAKIEQKSEASKNFVKSIEKDLVAFLVGDIRPFNAVEGALPPLNFLYFLNRNYILDLLLLLFT